MYRRKRKRLILIILAILPTLIIGYMAFTALGEELNIAEPNGVIISENLAKLPESSTDAKPASDNNPTNISNGRIYAAQTEEKEKPIPDRYGSVSDKANLEKLIDKIIEISNTNSNEEDVWN